MDDYMSDALSQTLTPNQVALWQQYLSAEAKGQRKSALQDLRAFITALQGDTELRQSEFSKAFCTQVADEGRILPLREPLFAGIIGPFLAAMNHQHEAAAPAWIAHFYDHICNMPEAQRALLDLSHKSKQDILREALARDPDNPQIRKHLIQTMVSDFEYAVHEVPSGVLYGTDGATVEQCQEWQAEVVLFRELIQHQDDAMIYKQRIHYWEFHFHGYADYLTHHDRYHNYADYIQSHWKAAPG